MSGEGGKLEGAVEDGDNRVHDEGREPRTRTGPDACHGAVTRTRTKVREPPVSGMMRVAFFQMEFSGKRTGGVAAGVQEPGAREEDISGV